MSRSKTTESPPTEAADATPEAEESGYRRPSRSQAKRDAKLVEPLAARLVTLKPAVLERLDLDERLRAEIEQCRPLKRTARKRQLKRLAGLLRAEDWQEIQAAVEAL